MIHEIRRESSMFEHLNDLVSKADWNEADERKVHRLSREERQYVAANAVFDGILADLSLDREDTVRLYLLDNPQLPLTIIKRMSERDSSSDVLCKARRRLEDTAR
jgi:ABC-type cobalamin transport system ATPase subunit